MSTATTEYLLAVAAPEHPRAELFQNGRPVRHPDGTMVYFVDDQWVLRIAHGPSGLMTANFHSLPEWICPYAKKLVARDWLGRGRSMSKLAGMITALRRGARALRPFEGPTIEDLTPDHALRVRRWLEVRWELGRDAVAAAELAKGSALAPRQMKAALRKVGGLGPRAIGNTVFYLNEVVRLARAEGREIDCNFMKPRDVRVETRAAGGADPLKVLTEDELAAVIDAAQQDIDAYREAAGEIEAAFSPERLQKLTGDAGAAYRRLSRYFGLNGYQMNSLGQIARDESVAAAGFARALRPHLSKAVGDEMADRLWRLRALLPKQGVRATSEERGAAREELNRLLPQVNLSPLLGRGRSKYYEPFLRLYSLAGFHPHTHSEAAAASGVRERRLEQEADRYLLKMVGDTATAERIRDLRRDLRRLHSRAIKACALQVLATTFRRVSAPLLSLSPTPETRWVEHRGERLFGIKVTSFKMWGDAGLPEWVELPGFHGETAEAALKTATELTEKLRPFVDDDAADHLFIIPDRSSRKSVALSPRVFSDYVYTNGKGRGPGILRRRGVPRAEEISVHFFRHTHITAIISATGSAILAARIAGNSPAQSLTTYFAGGTHEARVQSRKQAEQGRLTGFLWDAAVRVGMEASGEVDESVPAGQLPLEAALQRLRDNPEFLSDYLHGETEPTPQAVQQFLAQGVVVNLTSKGGCILPVAEGPCPASEDCPIGCDPEANERQPGCGCRWQVQIPHDDALHTMNADLEAMRAERAFFADQKGYEGWVQHQDKRIACWEAQVETLDALKLDPGEV